MLTMTNSVLTKVKDEYCQALVERMSTKEMRAYLFQIFSNDVTYDSMEEMRVKIINIFDEEFYETLLADISKELDRSSSKKTRLKIVD